MSFVTLDEHQLEIMLHRAAALAVAELRQDIERNTHPPLMDKAQLAVYLGCHLSTINRQMKRGMPFEMLGDQPRYRKADIDLWLKGKSWASSNDSMESEFCPVRRIMPEAHGICINGSTGK